MLINHMHLWQNIYFLIVLFSRHKIGECIACFMNFSLTLPVHHDYNVDYFVRLSFPGTFALIHV